MEARVSDMARRNSCAVATQCREYQRLGFVPAARAPFSVVRASWVIAEKRRNASQEREKAFSRIVLSNLLKQM
jgi:hypothetical protein